MSPFRLSSPQCREQVLRLVSGRESAITEESLRDALATAKARTLEFAQPLVEDWMRRKDVRIYRVQPQVQRDTLQAMMEAAGEGVEEKGNVLGAAAGLLGLVTGSEEKTAGVKKGIKAAKIGVKILQASSKVGGIFTLGGAAYEIATAEDLARALAIVVPGTVAGVGGGAAGAKAGAAIGAIAGPIGIVGGLLVGGIVGGWLGDKAGRAVAERAYDGAQDIREEVRKRRQLVLLEYCLLELAMITPDDPALRDFVLPPMHPE